MYGLAMPSNTRLTPRHAESQSALLDIQCETAISQARAVSNAFISVAMSASIWHLSNYIMIDIGRVWRLYYAETLRR